MDLQDNIDVPSYDEEDMLVGSTSDNENADGGFNFVDKKNSRRHLFLGKRTPQQDKKRSGHIHRIFIGKRGEIKRIFIG